MAAEQDAQIARIEATLQAHEEADARAFDRFDNSFRFISTRMDQQFDSIKKDLGTLVERTVAVETMIKVAKDEGGKAGAKWASAIALVISALAAVVLKLVGF